MSLARYAIYYVPPKDSDLAVFGREWLGLDIESGQPHPMQPVQGLSEERLRLHVADTQPYGFHATLKPPFSLAANVTLNGLISATELFAKGVAPFEIPPLELVCIGKFLALSPVASSVQLENMASDCVRAVEGFRAHRTEKELALYRQAKLTVHQEQMLDNWGYPYILEEFRFHMTLTGRIEDESERDLAMAAASEQCKEFVGKPLLINDIVICRKPSPDQSMRIVRRIPFGRV
ncbi:MAG: DUF1045 domain-containing protein [Alphaproteobacteria bacterium]|nr:DUF1045 domain-containing protein [Alphaproteobacteria bacterium]